MAKGWGRFGGFSLVRRGGGGGSFLCPGRVGDVQEGDKLNPLEQKKEPDRSAGSPRCPPRVIAVTLPHPLR